MVVLAVPKLCLACLIVLAFLWIFFGLCFERGLCLVYFGVFSVDYKRDFVEKIHMGF